MTMKVTKPASCQNAVSSNFDDDLEIDFYIENQPTLTEK